MSQAKLEGDTGKPCPRCGGQGYVYSYGFATNCPFCEGTGTAPAPAGDPPDQSEDPLGMVATNARSLRTLVAEHQAQVMQIFDSGCTTISLMTVFGWLNELAAILEGCEEPASAESDRDRAILAADDTGVEAAGLQEYGLALTRWNEKGPNPHGNPLRRAFMEGLQLGNAAKDAALKALRERWDDKANTLNAEWQDDEGNSGFSEAVTTYRLCANEIRALLSTKDTPTAPERSE